MNEVKLQSYLAEAKSVHCHYMTYEDDGLQPLKTNCK